MNRSFLAGALTLILTAVGLFGQAKQPTVKSQKELDAVQAMFKAQDPDSRIQAADTLITRFADTEFKAIALYLTAVSYEQKGDFEKMIIYGEQTLQADPKNYGAMLMMAGGIAKRAREFDLDLEEKLSRADKLAKSAIEVLKDAPKPNPQITDDQWAAEKKNMVAQAHEVFALEAMVRKKYDAAIPEFKEAIDGAAQPDPATMVRLAQTYNLAKRPDDALAVVEKVMVMPDVHPQIKQVAQAERVRAMQAKGGGAAKPAASQPAPPPAPAAPAPAEPKKQ